MASSFSASSAFRRCASETFMPPNLAFQPYLAQEANDLFLGVTLAHGADLHLGLIEL